MRITKRLPDGSVFVPPSVDMPIIEYIKYLELVDAALQKLCAYEDTELEPEQIKTVIGTWQTVVVKGVGWWKECSVCGAHWTMSATKHICEETEFCHRCGAKMQINEREVEKNDC